MLVIRTILLGLICVFSFKKDQAQTADEIIQKHIEAIGGYEKVKAIKTIVFEGTIKFKDHERAFKSYIIHDSACRTENTEYGKTGYGIITKTEGWTYNSTKSSIKKKSKQEVKEAQNTLDLHGPLIDYKEKGNKIKYLGKEKIGNNDYFKLRVIKADKTLVFYFLDTAYFISRVIVQPTATNSNQYTSDYFYQPVDGGYFFIFKSIQLESGAETTYKYYLINPQIDRSLFVTHNP